MLRLIAKLLKVLNSESAPAQISLALTFGMIAGITPFWSVHNLAVLLLVCILRVNLSAFIAAVAVFSGVAYLLDPFMDNVGTGLLTDPSLQSFWTSLYNTTGWRITRFNNTLTLGSFVCAVSAAIPFFFISQVIIKQYRLRILAWVNRLRIVTWLQATPFYRLYRALSGATEV